MAETDLANFANQADGKVSIQVYVNSITLASVVAQLVILVTFLPDLSVFPASLKFLSIFTIVSSMMSALVVFISGNYACNPAIQIRCTFFLLGNMGKWCTYTLRVWLLSYRRNLGVMLLIGLLIGVHALTFQWWCAVSPAERVLPRLCSGPLTDEQLRWTDLTGSISGAVVNLVFIILHVYYLWDYFRDVFAGKTSAHLGGPSAILAPTNRFAATLRLFSGSILVMLVDFAQFTLRKFFTSDPLHFFILIWGAQIVSDIIYCSYMRRFANDLHREAQHTAKHPYEGAPRSTTLGLHPGGEIDYVALDPVGTVKPTSPVLADMPLPVPAAKGRPGLMARGFVG
ncbi:hypothetical protein M427DRAFT_54678 [Gonapodya prolifera JEL478]|uniref:Uncharacterized protein n=1 Tax=Gonapodya prolifera (strain JEL478) TaxID=1344416 RepID=A0A139AKS8_GONPJ|nr:hypothetical protein M427DRAFT_54678 [Gonapodya prolifera JEL478]|eukprot:KXS17389.1 hypothetical protein M427DRAFT_54678 [Gonapodya prolifera JEL478]